MRRDPAKAIVVLDAMLQFFDGGKRWTQGELRDYRRRRCLIGALEHIERQQRLRGSGAESYLRSAILSTGDSLDPLIRFAIALLNILPAPDDRDLTNYNDEAASYDEVRALIIEARAIAQAELDPPSLAARATPRQAPPMLHQHLVSERPTRGSRRSDLGKVTDSAETPVNIDFCWGELANP
jgi:hypothetical protein